MRFIMYGAGAVGGVVGGRLFESGHEVILIARGAHLEAIRQGGLEVQSPAGSVLLRMPAAGKPSEIQFRSGDVVLLSMKTQDTEAALLELRASAGDEIPVVCLQNGVENERLASRRFANVYGTAVMLPATHLEPGIVQANSAPITGVLDTGRFPSGTDSVAEELTTALERSTFSARPDPNIMRKKYTKLLMNLGNALQAVCGPDADTRELAIRAREEAKACYRAAGIDFATDEEDRERRGKLITIGRIGEQARKGGSTWQSVTRGKSSIEADYLNGEIVLLGRLHGVPTPVNRLLQNVSNELAREGRAPGAVGVDDLIAILGD
jgi:2-dehydropantoate 2-reductase